MQPSLKRAMSVTSGLFNFRVSSCRFMAPKSLPRLRYCHGRSLCPSIKGASFRILRTVAMLLASSVDPVFVSAEKLVVIIRAAIALVRNNVIMGMQFSYDLRWLLELGFWNFSGCWMLGFGVSLKF